MSTQTGSIDLRAAKKANDEASKVATNFVADISNGILVHPESDINIGVKITDKVEIIRNGIVVGSYGENAQVGNKDGFHIEMDGTKLGFYQGTRKVAYISNNQLYITQSVVLQQMDVGRPTTEIDPATGQYGLGQWSWKVHEVNGGNNLYLKWLG